MTQAGRRVWRIATVIAIFLIAGCAHFTGAGTHSGIQEPHWEGRLLVKVSGPQPQNFSAAFTLQGSAQAGSLSLYTPLGTTAAQVRWDRGTATLIQGGQTQAFESVAALTRSLTGTELPVNALFDWLRGQDASVPDWEVDLSQFGEGRIRARHLETAAPAEVRVVLER